MQRSKILREFVQSAAISDKEQHENETNNIGMLNEQLNNLRRSSVFLERQQSISTATTELFTNSLEVTENDVPKTESEPITVEIEEEKKKLIQKETIETGSVS